MNRARAARRAWAILLLTAGTAAHAQEADDDGSYTMQFSAGWGRFVGDYGEDEDTALDVLSLSARRYFTRAEVQLSVPYLKVDGGADVRFVDDRPVAVSEDEAAGDGKESGLGDVVLRGEYYVRTGSSTSPWVIALLRLKLPTGNEERGLGTGATDLEAGIGLIRRLGPVNWMADVGYTFVGGGSGFDPDNVWRIGGGVSVPFGVNERSNSYAYLENRTSRYDDSDDRLSLAVGYGTSLDEARRLRVAASVFVGLSDTAEDWGVYLTFGHRR